jgi:hypothetical protein
MATMAETRKNWLYISQRDFMININPDLPDQEENGDF